MSRKCLGKSFLDEEAAKEKEMQRKNPPGFVPWYNPNELQATDRITSATQGPHTSGTPRRMVVSSARQHQDTSDAEELSQPKPGRRNSPGAEELSQPKPGRRNRPGAEALSQPGPGRRPSTGSEALSQPEPGRRPSTGAAALSQPEPGRRPSTGAKRLSQLGLGRRPPMFQEEERPGAVFVPGMDSDGRTFEEGYDGQAINAPHEDESTINIIAQAVDIEEEERMRHELDELRQMQIRHERDQLRQMLDNAPKLTAVVAPRSDVENQNDDDLPSSDDPKCGSKRRRWCAVSATLLIMVAIAVTLAFVLQEEPPLPPDPLTEMLSNASSDGGIALADPSTPQNRALTWLAGNPNVYNYTPQVVIQLYALATLYYTTDGYGWNNNGYWLSNQSVCGKWYQSPDKTFVCTPDGAISSLDLRKNNLQGVIPPEIGMLSDSLNYLWFDENELKGTLPADIGKLTKLTSLSFLNNSLIGAIPSVIGFLTNLEDLWLYNNKLDGTLPTEIGALTKLTLLTLQINSLTGAIPSAIGLLTNLEKLALYENRLMGSLPTEMGDLTELTILYLFNNTLTGSIPSVIGPLTNLESLQLYDNELEGNIGPIIDALPRGLMDLELDKNLLTGTIPSSIGTFTDLTFLDLGENDLSGKIPTELGLLTKLTYLNLGPNKMTGTIPTELGLLTELTWLTLSSNQLTGTVPTSLASLPLLKLFLNGNDLTGSLSDFCKINLDLEAFAANNCYQKDEMNCTCCTHCCEDNGSCKEINL